MAKNDLNLVPTESEEQQALFRWAAYESGAHPELALLYHIPNEGKRSQIAGAKLRAEGLKRGVPDICLPVPRGKWHGLYIELKRQKGSQPTAEQVEWLDALAAEGHGVAWCRGWESAAGVLLEYLRTGKITYAPTEGRGGEWHAKGDGHGAFEDRAPGA